MSNLITKLDFVAIPSQDAERSRRFDGETLGLRPGPKAQYEFWACATWRSSPDPDGNDLMLHGRYEPRD